MTDPREEGLRGGLPSPTPDKGTRWLSSEDLLIYTQGQGRELFQPTHSHLATGPFCLQN